MVGTTSWLVQLLPTVHFKCIFKTLPAALIAFCFCHHSPQSILKTIVGCSRLEEQQNKFFHHFKVDQGNKSPITIKKHSHEFSQHAYSDRAVRGEHSLPDVGKLTSQVQHTRNCHFTVFSWAYQLSLPSPVAVCVGSAGADTLDKLSDAEGRLCHGTTLQMDQMNKKVPLSTIARDKAVC